MDTKKQIKTAFAYAGVTMSEIARRTGMTPQNLNQRITRDTLRADDLQRIAQAMGAEYISVFRFPDGKEI